MTKCYRQRRDQVSVSRQHTFKAISDKTIKTMNEHFEKSQCCNCSNI